MSDLIVQFEALVSSFGLIGIAVFWAIKVLCTWIAWRWWADRRATVAVKEKAGKIR